MSATKPMADQFRYVIVGAGLAGASAAEGIRERDKNGSIAVLGLEKYLPYNRPPLTKGLWTGKDKLEDIPVHDEKFYQSLNAQVFLHTGAARIERERRVVVDSKGNTHPYKSLLLATGGTPRHLPFADEPIQYYRTVEDYERVREMCKTFDEFCVIGGGFIGAELSAALNMQGKKVTVIIPDEFLLARILPGDLAGNVTEYYRNRGVVVRNRETAAGVDRKGGKVILRLKSGGEVAADAVIAAIGLQTGTALAEEAGLKLENGGIAVNERLQSSDAAIFAAGDVASWPAPSLDQTVRIEHWDNARAMGKQAGRNMAGANEPYTYLPYFWTDLFDLGSEAIGKVDSRLTTFPDWKEPFREGVVYYLENNRVKGVLLWNVWERVEKARELINGKAMYPRPGDLRGAL